MTFKKFLDNINAIYKQQANKSEGLRYGQIIMNELYKIWPEKYHRITGSDKDPFYALDNEKKAYDFLYDLEGAWPACPANLNKDQVRVQRLEKKIKKIQARNKGYRKDIEFYKKLTSYFPWVEKDYNARKEVLELKKVLKEKNWAIRGLQDALNVVRLISEEDLNKLKNLYEDFKVVEKNINEYLTDDPSETVSLLEKLISVVKAMKNNVQN